MVSIVENHPNRAHAEPKGWTADPYYSDERMHHQVGPDVSIPFYRKVLELEKLLDLKRTQGLNVIGVLPALNEGTNNGTRDAPIAETIENLMCMREKGLVDRFEVVCNGNDDTQQVVESAIDSYGDEALGFFYAPNLLSMYGLKGRQGKGGNLALATMMHPGPKDILVFIDTDCGMLPAQLQAIVSPLIEDPNVMLSLSMFERRTKAGNPDAPNHVEGGRVTSFQLQPNLEMFFPQLNGLSQPIAGLYAGRGSSLAKIEFPTDYRVETALIIESLMEHGSDALAQVWCGTKMQDGHGTQALRLMAAQINHEIFWQAHKHLGYPLPVGFIPGSRRAVNHTVTKKEGTVELGMSEIQLPIRNVAAPNTLESPHVLASQVSQCLVTLFRGA